MPRTRSISVSVLPCLALPLAACAPDADLPTWEPLDRDTIAARLTEPTAAVSELAEGELTDALGEDFPELVEAARGITYAFSIVSDLVADQPAVPAMSSGTGSGRGTNFFVSVSCPGDWEAPRTDFSRGEMRLDSATIGRDVIGFLSGGDVLATFRSCELGALRLNGRAPGRVELDLGVLGLGAYSPFDDPPKALAAFDVEALELAYGALRIRTLLVLCEGWAGCHSRQAFAAEVVGSAGSYVLFAELTADYFQNPTELVVSLNAAEATVECSYAPSRSTPFECDFDAPSP